MRWRQYTLSALCGVAAGAVAFVASDVSALGVGLAAAVLARVGLATLGRTRYYSSRRGHSYRICPGCRNAIRRRPGDLYLRCYTCGFREGWPLIRWLTQSVPAAQFRRSMGRRSWIALVLAAVIILAGISVASVAAIPAALGPAETVDTQGDGELTATQNNSEAENDDKIDTDAAAEQILELVNERRSERFRSHLWMNSYATRKAQAHADDMAANDYFAHTSPDGETQLQRYARCEGGENLMLMPINRRVDVNGTTVTITSADELAAATVEGWMASPPHREDGIYGDWRSAGIGVALTDKNAYVAMGFCRT